MGSAIVWQVWGENFFQTAKNICHAMTTLLDLAEAAALAQKWFRVENKRSAAAVDTNDADGTVQQRTHRPVGADDADGMVQQQAQKKLRLQEVSAPLAVSLAPLLSQSLAAAPMSVPTTVTAPVKVAPAATPTPLPARVLRKLPMLLARAKKPLTDEIVQEFTKDLVSYNNLEGGTMICTFTTQRDGKTVRLVLFQQKGEPLQVPYRWLHEGETISYFGLDPAASLAAAHNITVCV